MTVLGSQTGCLSFDLGSFIVGIYQCNESTHSVRDALWFTLRSFKPHPSPGVDREGSPTAAESAVLVLAPALDFKYMPLNVFLIVQI